MAAGGIALISSLGNLGSAASPMLAGVMTQYTGNKQYSIYLVLIMLGPLRHRADADHHAQSQSLKREDPPGSEKTQRA